jgi:hypothetical protein
MSMTSNAFWRSKKTTGRQAEWRVDEVHME